MKLPSVILSVLMILLLSACSGAATPSVATEETEGFQTAVIPTPEAGKAVVTAKMMNANTNAPLTDQLVRLAKIYGEGKDAIYVYNESGDPGAYTTADGTVAIPGVEPGPYAIILIDSIGNNSPIEESADKIWTVDAVAGQVIDLGTIDVDLSTP